MHHRSGRTFEKEVPGSSLDKFSGPKSHLLNCNPLVKHAPKILDKSSRLYFVRGNWMGNVPQCKGYSPCKILSLDQIFKTAKKCEKPFYNNIRIILCKKPLEKTPNI